MSLCDKCSAECRNKPTPGEVIIQCGAYKPPQTNADRIRAMSDEELAEQLTLELDGVAPCKLFVSLLTGGQYISRKFAKEKTLDWLQQPAEGEL